MKKTILLILVFVFSSITFAHRGRTDSKGGHIDHKTNTYHYHNKGKKK